MVAEVVASCDGVARLAECLELAVVDVRPTRDEDVLERDSRVAPFRHYRGLEYDGDASLCREVVAESAGDVLCNGNDYGWSDVNAEGRTL